MLNLQVKAKNYNEMRKTLDNLCVQLFEFEEKGFFDDGQNEWVHQRENYSLECSDVDGRPFPEEDTYNPKQTNFLDVLEKTQTNLRPKKKSNSKNKKRR